MSPRKPQRGARTTPARARRSLPASRAAQGYGSILRGLTRLLEGARYASARAVNALMTATYWEIGHRIVEHEQRGKHRAGYGEEFITRLSVDLSERFGRGFGKRNLFLMRGFYLAYPDILQTVSAQLGGGSSAVSKRSGPARKTETLSAQLVKPGPRAAIAQQVAMLHVLSEAFPKEKKLEQAIEKARKVIEGRKR